MSILHHSFWTKKISKLSILLNKKNFSSHGNILFLSIVYRFIIGSNSTMKKHPSQKIRTPESKVGDEANEVEDWDVTTSVFLPPLSSSPKIHTTDLYLQENSMNLPAPDNAKLVQLQQQPQNSKKLEDIAIDISDVIYSAKTWEKRPA